MPNHLQEYIEHIDALWDEYKLTGKSCEFGMFVWEGSQLKIEIGYSFNSILEEDDVVCYNTMRNFFSGGTK